VYDRQFEEAVAGYERALAADPSDIEARLGLAQVLSWLGRFGRSEEAYRAVLVADAGNVDARRGLAQVATWRGHLREGEARWLEVRASAPQDPAALVGLAANLRMQGRGRAALRTLDQAASVDPASPALRDERTLAERSVAPSVTPTYGYLSDSDDNRIHTFSVGGHWHVADPLQLSLNVLRRDLDQSGVAGLSIEVLAADLALTARAESGWGLTGGVGVWQPSGRADDRIATVTAALSSPVWWSTRADLTFTRRAYDVTALAADRGVQVDELRLDGSTRLGIRTSVSALASAARFEGTASNTRVLGGARLAYRFLPWVAAGPALRAFSFRRDIDDVYWDPDSYAVMELPVVLGPTEGAFLPRLELAPGYQRTSGEVEPWSVSMRVQGGLAYNVGPRRQIGISALLANSGFQRVSSVDDSDYEARGVTLLISWAF
jgi:hypothetical protein